MQRRQARNGKVFNIIIKRIRNKDRQEIKNTIEVYSTKDISALDENG